MELKLNIYNGKEVEKTYVTDDFRLMTGTCEDILNILEIEKLTSLLSSDLNSVDDEEFLKLIPMVVKLFGQFGPIMKDIFIGITDDEYRRTDIKEVTKIIWTVIQYTFGELFNASSKN